MFCSGKMHGYKNKRLHTQRFKKEPEGAVSNSCHLMRKYDLYTQVKVFSWSPLRDTVVQKQLDDTVSYKTSGHWQTEKS